MRLTAAQSRSDPLPKADEPLLLLHTFIDLLRTTVRIGVTSRSALVA
jgi:hypothetical protein